MTTPVKPLASCRNKVLPPLKYVDGLEHYCNAHCSKCDKWCSQAKLHNRLYCRVCGTNNGRLGAG